MLPMIFLFNTSVSAPPRVFKGREGIMKSNSLLKFCQSCCIFNRKKLSLHCFQDFLFKMLFYIYLSHFFQQGQGHCAKSVRIRSFSGPYFPAFGLNTGSYFVSLSIQSECEKIRTRKLRIRTFSRTCIFKKNNPSGIHNPFSITSFLKIFQISIFISLTS